MSDLIDRQAAIEWCRPEEWGTPDERWRPESEYGAMLEALPSAQPEIIRCKDCREFRRWIDTDITFCDLTESERDALDFCSRAERRTG